MRKTGILLEALDRLSQPFHYYALDLSRSELERTLGRIPAYVNVSTSGLQRIVEQFFGTDSLQAPTTMDLNGSSKIVIDSTVMSLGSSIGNFTREEASEFLQRFARVLNQNGDAMLIGLDGCQNKDRV